MSFVEYGTVIVATCSQTCLPLAGRAREGREESAPMSVPMWVCEEFAVVQSDVDDRDLEKKIVQGREKRGNSGAHSNSNSSSSSANASPNMSAETEGGAGRVG